MTISAWWIVGIVVAWVLAAVLVIGAIWISGRRRDRRVQDDISARGDAEQQAAHLRALKRLADGVDERRGGDRRVTERRVEERRRDDE